MYTQLVKSSMNKNSSSCEDDDVWLVSIAFAHSNPCWGQTEECVCLSALCITYSKFGVWVIGLFDSCYSFIYVSTEISFSPIPGRENFELGAWECNFPTATFVKPTWAYSWQEMPRNAIEWSDAGTATDPKSALAVRHDMLIDEVVSCSTYDNIDNNIWVY